MGIQKKLVPSLENPFHEPETKEFKIPGEIARKPGLYEESLKQGWDLMQRPETAAGVVAIENAGETDQTAIATYTGIPRVPEPAGGVGLSIERNYYDLAGNAIDVASIGQNQRFAVVLSVRVDHDVNGRLMLVDPLPAGFEIDNPNLLRSGNVNSLSWEGMLDSVTHAEYRSDRFVAVMNRQSGNATSFRVGYVARAVSPGTFAHPAATIEDMYRPELRARTDSARVEVVGPMR